MPNTRTSQDLCSWNGPLRARCDHYLTSPEFTAQGLLLGPRIRVLRADCTKVAATPGAAPSLGSDPLDGDLPRARALLSVAYGYPISPWQMSRLQAAAAVTGQRPALAGIILAHAGLSRISATPAHAERLYHAEKLLDSAALSPIALLDALDLLPDDWAIHKNHQWTFFPPDIPDGARKYSPTQPRVSAGNPEGGQFTRQSDGPVPIPVKVQAFHPEAIPIKHQSGKTTSCPGSGKVVPAPKAYYDWRKKIQNRVFGVPDGSQLVTAPDGHTFYAPGYADFAAAYVFGKSLREIPTPLDIPAIWMAVGYGGMYDFQRDGQTFIGEYTYASNCAVGIVLNGAGYSLVETKAIADGFAREFSSNYGDKKQISAWVNGWSAAQRGDCKR